MVISAQCLGLKLYQRHPFELGCLGHLLYFSCSTMQVRHFHNQNTKLHELFSHRILTTIGHTNYTVCY